MYILDVCIYMYAMNDDNPNKVSKKGHKMSHGALQFSSLEVLGGEWVVKMVHCGQISRIEPILFVNGVEGFQVLGENTAHDPPQVAEIVANFRQDVARQLNKVAKHFLRGLAPKILARERTEKGFLERADQLHKLGLRVPEK